MNITLASLVLAGLLAGGESRVYCIIQEPLWRTAGVSRLVSAYNQPADAGRSPSYCTRGRLRLHYEAGYLCQPAYALDDAMRGPVQSYVPQPGDIYLSTDRSWIIRAGHRLALSGQPNHSGIVFAMPDGRPAILEGGPFNGLKVEIVDLYYDLSHHTERSERCWIRARKTSLTPEQSEQLTTWALEQNGKPFAARRMLRQLTPFRTRGPWRTSVMGAPHGARSRYFCSELVLESCVHVGLLDADNTRPSATYPEDLFFDQSKNRYLNTHFTLADGWHPPARWLDSVP